LLKKGSLLAVGDGLLVDQWRGGVNPKTVEPVKNIIIIADASIVHFRDGIVYATRFLRWVQNDHEGKTRREKTQSLHPRAKYSRYKSMGIN